MKLLVSFDELKKLLCKKTGVPLDFRYENESKFKVSSYVTVPFIGEKEISLLLAIESASFGCVQLRNDSGMVARVMLNMLEGLVDKIVSKTSPSKLVDIGNNSMEIYPNVIEKVKEIERFLVMHSIVVVDKGFAVNFSCREN